VEEAVMESTAQYWRPVWYELEPHLQLQLAQAFSGSCPKSVIGAERIVIQQLSSQCK
jgi:hypothetical protein